MIGGEVGDGSVEVLHRLDPLAVDAAHQVSGLEARLRGDAATCHVHDHQALGTLAEIEAARQLRRDLRQLEAQVRIPDVGLGATATAADAGLGQDVVVELAELHRHLLALALPQDVELDILREGERKKVTVELGELNDDVLAEAGVRRGGGGAQPDIRDPHLGLELAEITPQLARRFDLSERAEGLVIVDVARGSVAAEAGLEPGDLVRSVNRKRVESMQDFDAAVADLPADHPLVLQVKRGSRSFFVTLERSS